MICQFSLSFSDTQYLQNYSGERNNTNHIIYKTVQGREATLTTIFTKLFRGENKHIYDNYKTIQGRELTLTTIFTKLFRGENKHIYNIYKTIQGRELTLTTIFTKLFKGEN